jgi:hypothetical protein
MQFLLHRFRGYGDADPIEISDDGEEKESREYEIAIPQGAIISQR